jgi:rod shape-determining protein MreD
MIVTPKILARLVAIAILVVLLQISFFSRVTLLETSPDILPSFVVVLALLGGSLTGAVAGFAIGFLVDCLLAGTLGATSLVLLGVGYLAGLFRERFEIHSALVVPLLCMALTLFAELGFAIVQLTRRSGQRLCRPRHAAEEHLRLRPRLDPLLRRPPRTALSAGRGGAAPAATSPTDGAGNLMAGLET